MDRSGLIPVCPKCGKPDWLEFAVVFRASSGKLLRELWQCSKAYEGWEGCGWQGSAPRRTRHVNLQRTLPVSGVAVDSFTGLLYSLQESADLILVEHPDKREIVS